MMGSSSFDRKHLPSSERRKVIYRSVSCILLSKIAVDKSISGQGLGKWLLGKAIKQAFLSSRDVGVYALFLQSVEGKEEFYIDDSFDLNNDHDNDAANPTRQRSDG